jgi:hypothetical protein
VTWPFNGNGSPNYARCADAAASGIQDQPTGQPFRKPAIILGTPDTELVSARTGRRGWTIGVKLDPCTRSSSAEAAASARIQATSDIRFS